ncbi:receptor-type tyrosine-protein phosphatase delta-like [Mytilus edulis]|uniref:receptor-type tyrosine-protein phosphatase delta-like n=1 Tax=Mytilus edulis TaxID=6550 RepID=UPI0039EE223E
MFVPSILKICPTDEGTGIYLEWTIPEKDCKPPVHGYIVAYKRHELDINYSCRSLKGGRTCSHVISLSRVSSKYNIMVSAYGYKEHGDFCPPVILCMSDYLDVNRSQGCGDIRELLPKPKITKTKSLHEGKGLHLKWRVPLDVSNVIIEGYIVAYKRCGLDTQYKEKMVPGMNTKCHAITGTKPCTLYEVKVAACANEGTGLFSVPVIVRTGVENQQPQKMSERGEPTFTPAITGICNIIGHPGVFVRWKIPDNADMKNVDGYIVAFRKTVPSTAEYHRCVIHDNSMTSHYKEGLQFGMTYQVKVAAYNSLGCGQFTLPKLFVFHGKDASKRRKLNRKLKFKTKIS